MHLRITIAVAFKTVDHMVTGGEENNRSSSSSAKGAEYNV
jgi:hypothetical protein